GLKIEGLRAQDLKPLSQRISSAISPMTGEKRAEEIRRGIIEYMKALETLSEHKKGGEPEIEAELTVSDKKLAIGLIEEAEAAARRALDIAARVEAGDALRARVLYKLARTLGYRKENHKEAEAHYKEAISLAERARDAFALATAWSGLGALAWRVGDHKRALDNYKKALRLLSALTPVSKGEKTRLDNTMANIHSGLGNVYLDLVKMEESIAHQERALAIYKDLEDWGQVGRAYNNLARVYEEMGRYPEAIDRYERGVQYTRRGKASRMEGWTLTNLASALADAGMVDRARAPLERAERLLADFSDPIAHSKLHCMWGKYHRAKKEWDKGIERFRRSIEVIADENAPDYLATAQEEFGMLYYQKGEGERAAEQLSAALHWWRRAVNEPKVEKIEKLLKALKKKG
ncbi:MAG: tetratricopeptide repeat protein, partial [Candidatus Thermoplasmatota archaeon]